MREIRLSGSVEGVVSDHDSYSDCVRPLHSMIVPAERLVLLHQR